MRLLPSVLESGQAYNISTFAGGGVPANIPGISASLDEDVPTVIAADRAGNVFFVDQNTVVRLDAVTGLLSVVAGTGPPASAATMAPPSAPN